MITLIYSREIEWRGVIQEVRMVNIMVQCQQSCHSYEVETGMFFLYGDMICKQEDKRATTNVQNRFVPFFLLSLLLFCSP